MARKQQPDYASMDVNELSRAAAMHRQAIREIRAAGGEPLDMELAIAVHRAHLQVINPLRTQRLAEGEFMQSDIARKARHMTPEQWAQLHQMVNAPVSILEGDTHTPGAQG